MNILTDTLPEELDICGKTYHIKSDFKTWIKFSQIVFSGEIDYKKLAKALRLVLDELPPGLEETVNAVMNFYNPPKKQSKAQKSKNQKRVYDFDYDAELIYSAFLQQYKIDLTTAELHWWQFKALLDCLTDETNFIKVVGYRSINLSEIKNKEQKKFYREMKELHKLPDNRTEEQKEADFVSGFLDSFI